jgi:hypothetical protein
MVNSNREQRTVTEVTRPKAITAPSDGCPLNWTLPCWGVAPRGDLLPLPLFPPLPSSSPPSCHPIKKKHHASGCACAVQRANTCLKTLRPAASLFVTMHILRSLNVAWGNLCLKLAQRTLVDTSLILSCRGTILIYNLDIQSWCAVYARDLLTIEERCNARLVECIAASPRGSSQLAATQGRFRLSNGRTERMASCHIRVE